LDPLAGPGHHVDTPSKPTGREREGEGERETETSILCSQGERDGDTGRIERMQWG